jgi:hypothetical protein
MQLMPVFKGMITPEAAVAMLEYSPLPSKLVEQFKRMVEQGKEPPPEVREQQAIAKAGALAKVEKDQASAEASRAKAVLDLANASAAGAQAEADRLRAAIIADAAMPTTRVLDGDYAVEPLGEPTRQARPAPGVPFPPAGPGLPELPMAAGEAMPEPPLSNGLAR